jgi:hypothetical protein
MTDQPVSDPASGLFSEAMLRALLPSRVATARRTLRQLGLILVRIIDGPEPQELADLVLHVVRDSDMAARFDDGRIALVLEFTPGEGCLVVAKRLQTTVNESHPEATVTSGIACYPAHAISSDELVTTAADALSGTDPGGVIIAAVPE